MLDKYAKDIEEEENFYKQKLKEKEVQSVTEKEEIQAIVKEMTTKRPVLQTNFERVKPIPSSKDKPNSREVNGYSGLQRSREVERQQLGGSGPNLGGGFSKDLNKSGKQKKANNAIEATKYNPNLNSRTAAQLDRLTNICLEASKQDMIMNELYTQLKPNSPPKTLKPTKPTKSSKPAKSSKAPGSKSALSTVSSWLSQTSTPAAANTPSTPLRPALPDALTSVLSKYPAAKAPSRPQPARTAPTAALRGLNCQLSCCRMGVVRDERDDWEDPALFYRKATG